MATGKEKADKHASSSLHTGSSEKNGHKASKNSFRPEPPSSTSDRKRIRDPDLDEIPKVKRFRKRKSKDEEKKVKQDESKNKETRTKKVLEPKSTSEQQTIAAPVPAPAPPPPPVKRKRVPEGKVQTRHKKSRDGLLPILDAQYELKFVIKGHADRISQQTRQLKDDEDVNLWACEFEPEQDSNVVAICGANNVLFLDAQKGSFIKKYTHPEAKEEFLCLAWTILRGPNDLLDDEAADDDTCTILAVAGRLGSVKLINYMQNECYRYLFGHQRQIHRMLFHKNYKRWLFTASDDMSIRLWDIGSPNKERMGSTCLAKFAVPSTASVPAAMSVAPDNIYLMVGCTDGHMLRYNISRQTLLALEDRSKDDKQPMQTLKPSILYPDGDEWHEGYIDDVYVLGQNSTDGKHKLDGCIVSRGSDDYETIVWNPETSTLEDADILMSFEWPDSDDYSGTRFKVIEQNGKKAMIAGDYEGHIRIYDIGNSPFSKTLEDNSKEQFPEKKLLSHSASRRLVRDVTCSGDTGILVSVNNGNEIFVWHQK